MASASLLHTKATLTRGRDEVFVAAVPLRATRGPAQLLMSAAYALSVWDLQHFMVIIKPSSHPLHSQVFVFDFQPKDPENIYTALEVISGRAVRGAVLTRRLAKVPRRRCWFVGTSEGSSVEKAIKFSNKWETDLKVGHHDCRDYTNGEKHVLQRLRRSTAVQS